MSGQQVAAATQEPLAPVQFGEHFAITPSGLIVTGKPSFEQCEHLWVALKTLEKALAFAIGDALRYFEDRWGEKASQIVDASGLSFETCRAYRWLAEKVAPDNRRMDALTTTHHMAVAKLTPREQKKWLTQAADGDDGKPWSTARLRQAIKAGADPKISAWCVRAEFASEAKRDDARRYLEGLGGIVATSEKRG